MSHYLFPFLSRHLLCGCARQRRRHDAEWILCIRHRIRNEIPYSFRLCLSLQFFRIFFLASTSSGSRKIRRNSARVGVERVQMASSSCLCVTTLETSSYPIGFNLVSHLHVYGEPKWLPKEGKHAQSERTRKKWTSGISERRIFGAKMRS